MNAPAKAPSSDMAIHEEAALTKLKHFQEMVTANQNIQSIGPTPSSVVGFAELFAYVRVYCNDRGFKLPSGAFAKFEGDAYGVGFGGGVTWMTAVFTVPESDIFGDVSFTFDSSIAMTALTFWKESRMVGTAVGAGLHVGGGKSGGWGKFTRG
jgi:hypothetical protein